MMDLRISRPIAAFAVALFAGLAIPTGPAQAKIDVTEEIHCLALNIYHEARSEPVAGQRAVGHVVLNRVSDKRFPNTICAVIKQGGYKKRHRCQFSWWCDGRSDEPLEVRAWQNSKTLARSIFWGFSDDPTYGALWYHTEAVKPIWRHSLLRGPQIGEHIFYLKKDAAKPGAVQSASR